VIGVGFVHLRGGVVLQGAEKIESHHSDIPADPTELSQRSGSFAIHDVNIFRNFSHAEHTEQYDDHSDDGGKCDKEKEPATHFEIAEQN
jgi:hypothetical protein